MLLRVVLLYLVLSVCGVWCQEQCTDLKGRHIAHGFHYVPGPDTCTLCVCDDGQPKVCKAVLCSPPQDCGSFRVGNSCCEFICLDDVVKPISGSEINFRVAATGAAFVVILTVALIVYRVKRQKINRPTLTDDQRSLASIGYMDGSMGYLGGHCETSLSGWKPPGHYLPRGEAPPPYDEAMAQSREHNRMMIEQYHRSHPALDSEQCGAHYANLPRPQQQMANPQGCFATPLLQSVPPESQVIPHQPAHVALRGYPVSLSLSTIAGRALAHSLATSQLPSFYARSPALHRTIPRISTAEASLDTPLGFSRERSSAAEVRRSFDRPSQRFSCAARSMPRHLNFACETTDASPRQNSNRSPRATPELTPQRIATELPPAYTSNPPAVRTMSDPNRAARNDCHRVRTMTDDNGMLNRTLNDSHRNRTPNSPIVNDTRRVNTMVDPLEAGIDVATRMINDFRGARSMTDNRGVLKDFHGARTVENNAPRTSNDHQHGSKTMTEACIESQGMKTVSDPAGPKVSADPSTATPTILPLPVDKPSCVCSYSEVGAASGEDADDYRNECENCKATSGSKWAVESAVGWAMEEETQSLQRRPPPAAPRPPPPLLPSAKLATATLPLPQPLRNTRPTFEPSTYENWFSPIPDTDSDSEGD